jgi:hypothetical protein
MEVAVQLSSDRTGFPYIHIPELDIELALLPVLKVQYERYLAEPTGPGNAWYEEVLSVSPRASWRRFDDETRGGIFMTGVASAEAVAFNRWLGPEHRLPTVMEWRRAEAWLVLQSLEPARFFASIEKGDLAPQSRAILGTLVKALAPRTLAEVALLRGGVLEWVAHHESFRLLGAPRGTVCDPQFDPPVRLLAEERQRDVGFRPVRCRPGRRTGHVS